MIVVKLILKIVCIPIVLVLTVMQLVLTFLSAMTGWFFYLLALIVFATGILSLGFGLEKGSEAFKIFVASFILYFFPIFANWLIVYLEAIKNRLGK